MKFLRDRLHEGLLGRIFDIRLNGHLQRRLPNTLNISFKGLEANRILEEIGLEVAASAGAACHADSLEISHVLIAMGIPVEWAKGTIRFSVGRMTTETEIDKTIRVVADSVNKLKALC
jgi:cysteine desulfurase